MDLGDGETIEGGGTVTFAYCRQTFVVSEVLSGKMSTGKVELTYGFVAESDAFPGPRQERAIPAEVQVILLIGADGMILKALSDSPSNRKAVRMELEQAEEKAA